MKHAAHRSLIRACDAPLVASTGCKELFVVVASRDATYLSIGCAYTSRSQRGLKSSDPRPIGLLKHLFDLFEALSRYEHVEVHCGIGSRTSALITDKSPCDLTRVGSIQGGLFTC